IPFCAAKCLYCDFYSVPGRLELLDNYVEAVIGEARGYPGQSFDTLYIGGGTPSLLGPQYLEKLVSGLRSAFELTELQEATIEANPESVTAEFLQAARDCGVNRISLGVQSLNDGELGKAGRVHSSQKAVDAIKLTQKAGFANISADVMVGLPGQTRRSLGHTLEALAGLHVTHLSVYCLSVEDGTPFAACLPADLPGDDEQVELFGRAAAYLERQGFIHYEISNFALPGRECRHNLNYWRGGEYVGLGAAAASHVDGIRYKNAATLSEYIAHPRGVRIEVERLKPEEKLAEEAMLRLRLLQEGVDTNNLAARHGCEKVATLKERLDGQVAQNNLVKNGTCYRLPPSGVMTSNRVLAEVLA
ncbi:MAG: radical SAM family heme chaperone HemW, partial [Dehalococcoidia bacterium]|nr:radical SAM family heme chaperone HemW [Dehalococcoidia bacterium]